MDFHCDDLFEREALAKGFMVIAGLDEVGRGALFGPVAAAAVILDLDRLPPGIDDSKKLTANQRERLADEIRKTAKDYSIAFVESTVVDKINILAATREAMAEAICGLKEKPSFLLCDAIFLPGVEIPQRGIIKGDCQSVSIAAASILAKVERDRFILQLAKEYPGYELEKNKGYGTARHLRALRQLGPTPLHRRSFRGVLDPVFELPFEP